MIHLDSVHVRVPTRLWTLLGTGVSAPDILCAARCGGSLRVGKDFVSIPNPVARLD